MSGDQRASTAASGDELDLLAAGIVSASPSRDLADGRSGPLNRLVEGPSAWPLRPHPVPDWGAYLSRVGAPQRWDVPDVALAGHELDAFAELVRAAGLEHIRVVVDDVARWRRLAGRSIPMPRDGGQVRVSAYVSAPERGRWSWRWPLRVGVSGPDAASLQHALHGTGAYADLYEVFVADAGDECEVLVVSGGLGASVAGASLVVLNGIDPLGGEPPPSVTGTAGRVLSPAPLPVWFEAFVVELSHDLPVDVALGLAQPGALLEASDEFVARTTIRLWARQVADRLRGAGDAVAADEIEHEISEPFDSERQAGRRTAAVARAAEVRGIDIRLRGLPPPTAAAMPDPEQDVEEAEAAQQEEDEDATAAESTDDRRLQVAVRQRAGRRRTVTDRFLPGVEHDVRVCIAAEQRAGARVAAVPFRHPRPGRAVMLDVSVIAGDQRTVRRLRLPPTADTAWTKPVTFLVPDDPVGFAVQVEVAYRRRVIQSAVLSGEPFELGVDVSTPSDAVAGRPAAGALLTIVDAPSGEPTVIDLDRDIGDLDPAQVRKATERLRKELFAAFVAPPGDLAAAAGPLTRLAVRGRTLYDRLAGAAGGYHEHDSWIHVHSFGTSDVPLELAYSHPLPDDDERVPVCDEALAGAWSCTAGCPSRSRSDVVCPFGFWATSKVLERHSHVAGRTVQLPAPLRSVHPLSSSVIGISRQADDVDPTASRRITAALTQAVPGAAVALSWSQLEQLAAAHPSLVVLVTHTVLPEDGDDLDTALELNGDLRKLHRITAAVVNPDRRQPGPIVLALGCDTNTITAGFTDLVVTLQAARAEIVLSALSPIPGQGVADFLERFLQILSTQLGRSGRHRFGAAMLAARQATICTGDLMALALTATGDADVELVR